MFNSMKDKLHAIKDAKDNLFRRAHYTSLGIAIPFLPFVAQTDGIGEVLCGLLETLTDDVFIPLAIVGALAGAIWLAVAYALSGVMPEMSQRARQAPKNILIGLLVFAIGPALITTLADALGFGFSC